MTIRSADQSISRQHAAVNGKHPPLVLTRYRCMMEGVSTESMFTARQHVLSGLRPSAALALLILAITWSAPASAAILWSHSGPLLAHETGEGSDILHGAVKRDDKASDTLFFKFHVEPLSDISTEEYYAG